MLSAFAFASLPAVPCLKNARADFSTEWWKMCVESSPVSISCHSEKIERYERRSRARHGASTERAIINTGHIVHTRKGYYGNYFGTALR